MIPDDPAQIPGTENDGCKSKKGQNNFTGFIPKFPAPGHAGVFNEMQVEPWSNFISLTKMKIRFNPNFENLIYDYN